MPEYLVELYSAGDPDPAALARLGDGSAVRYLRSILIPSDETSLHLFAAESAERVAEAFEQAGLTVNRVFGWRGAILATVLIVATGAAQASASSAPIVITY